jgi:hypothetical protein
MFALPIKANLSADMVRDLRFKSARPGMKFLDVTHYMLFKFGRGLYQTSPAPPVRPVRFVRSRR